MSDTASDQASDTAREDNGAVTAGWEPPTLASRNAAQPTKDPAESPGVLRDKARQEGYDAGYAEGVAAGRARGEALAMEMQSLLQSLATPLADLDAAVVNELLALVERVCSAVLQRELREQSNIEAALQQGLALLGEGRNAMEITLHPQDAALCRELGMLSGDDVQIVEDPRLTRGGAHLTAGGSYVDVSVERRLETVMESLRGELESGAVASAVDAEQGSGDENNG